MLFKANDIAGTKSTYAGIWSLLHANTVGAHSGKLVFGTTSGGNLVERLRIDESGNVGIGTTAPDVNLVVEAATGDATLRVHAAENNSGSDPILILESSNDFAESTIEFKDSSGTGGAIRYNHGDNALRFQTNGTSERARIDSSGRLLVGTSSSSNVTRAEFYGQSSSSTEQAIVRFGRGSNPGGAGDHLTTLQFAALTSGGVYATIEALCDATPGTNDYPGRLTFSTTADGASSPTERMRISANGDILAGSTSTWATAGSGASFYIHNNSDQQTLRVSNGDPGSAPYGLIGFYRNKGSLIARISTDGSTVSYNTSSDYRLKENVTPVSDGITRLQQLKPSRFNFIADPDKTVDGFLAHEVQTIIPEAITGEKDAVDDEGNPEYQGIDQSKLVPLLTAALQEAVARIEAQDTTIASLEARLTALEGGTN
jgi:hypothetical protein